KIQIIWDLCHFGYPDGLIPTHPQFPARFMALCRAFALFHNSYTGEPLLIVPINEISFLSWHSGEVRGTVPFAVNCGFDIKYHLCKAAIEGIMILKQTAPDVQILLVEPLVKIHPVGEEPVTEEILELNSHQFQAMDIIMGRLCPELGGSPFLGDMLGFNYYYNNQWEHKGRILPWPSEDTVLTPMYILLRDAYKRYNKPVILTETGHFGDDRSLWMEEITTECDKAISLGVDLRGLCIYPVIDRPDWDNLQSYSNCGIWDLDGDKNRIAHETTRTTVKRCMDFMERRLKQKTGNPVQDNLMGQPIPE
ncbi:hypothetical protein RM553_14035, partial [Zunongwangia sp. F363]